MDSYINQPVMNMKKGVICKTAICIPAHVCNRAYGGSVWFRKGFAPCYSCLLLLLLLLVTVGLESFFVLVLADLLFSLLYDTAHGKFLSYSFYLLVLLFGEGFAFYQINSNFTISFFALSK